MNQNLMQIGMLIIFIGIIALFIGTFFTAIKCQEFSIQSRTGGLRVNQFQHNRKISECLKCFKHF